MTVAPAPCLRGVTVCCLYSVCLTTFRPHIWSGQASPGYTQVFPPGSSTPPRRAEGRAREQTSRGRFNKSRSRPWNEQIMASHQLQSGMIHSVTFQQRFGWSSFLMLSQLLIPQYNFFIKLFLIVGVPQVIINIYMFRICVLFALLKAGFFFATLATHRHILSISV